VLNLIQLQTAVASAKRQFDLIRKKHPQMKAFLVISLPGGQTEIDSTPAQILGSFPLMVVNDSNKGAALNLLHRHEKLELEAKTGQELRLMRDQFEQLLSQLRYDETCQVEIRFNDLIFDLVWKLQLDDLVNRDLTPRTKASICIVLGTLAQFKGTL